MGKDLYDIGGAKDFFNQDAKEMLTILKLAS